MQSRRFSLTDFLRELLPLTKMGKALLAGLVVWAVNWAFSEGRTVFGSELLKLLLDIASVLALIPLGYFLVRLARWVTGQLLWRVRRRLIVTYLLIGALPLLLILLLVFLVGYAVIMQSSANLVTRQLDGYLEQSREAARAFGRELEQVDLPAAQLRSRLQERADALASVFPELELSWRQGAQTSFAVRGRSAAHEMNGASAGVGDPPPPAPLPRWLQTQLEQQPEFHHLVVEQAARGERRIFARHLIRLSGAAPRVLELSYPLGARLCEHFNHTTDLTIKPGQALTPLIMTPQGPRLDERRLAGQPAPPEAQTGGLPIFKDLIEWQAGEPMQSEVLWVDSSFLLPAQLWQRVQEFKSGSVFGGAIIWAIGGLSVIFFLIALTAIVSAFVMTRSITGTVHRLYEGTRRVEAGDLAHEIPLTARDQLGELGRSFNQMMRSIRELLRVSAEKQRLDQEMRIAAEVQARLFPRTLPQIATLDFAPGICIPARAVSGDYYDFIEIAPGLSAVVIADVCGKGVSAALMMANLQANLRGCVQLAPPRELYLHSREVRRIVARVNKQMAAAVIDASYVTLFYAEFDEQSSCLRYTNAGHNPPLLVRAVGSGQPHVEKLETGGTVVGLFADSEYEDAELQLVSGDAFVAFTDGLIEARNQQGEEFGEERLIELLLREAALPAEALKAAILAAVRQWTGGAEQEDDLTLVVFKRR